MANREQKAASILLLVMFLPFLMFQYKVTTRFSRSCSPACHMEVTRTRKLYVMAQDFGGGDDDYDYNNNFYRRQGDVPSPGVGH
ncbi:hypothetical protein SLEP1_g5148 [Rubroshorea leprosula]|uniref:Uncharacterized protein n=1 Tax=Rubroshorea leprosula TaxID=152421 RepID=A0AAV5HRC3_9ROSI|nr:hypothetical protein SLEP1_g5148 [Rubroshorea leprosula]